MSTYLLLPLPDGNVAWYREEPNDTYTPLGIHAPGVEPAEYIEACE